MRVNGRGNSRRKGYAVLVLLVLLLLVVLVLDLLLRAIRMRARPAVMRFGSILMMMLVVLLVEPQLLAMGQRARICHNSASSSAIYTISLYPI